MKIDVVVMAGGKGISEGQVQTKSLLLLDGKPMVLYILKVLRESELIGKIILSASSEVGEIVQGWYDVQVEQSDRMVDNLLNSIKETSSEHVLVASSDVPLVNKTHLEWFVKEAIATNADLVMPYSDKETILQAFPCAKRTFSKLKEGVFTLGNLALIKHSIPYNFVDLFYKVEKFRKNPLKLATLLGWNLILRYVLGILSVEEIEKRASEIIKCKVKGLLSPYPEIAMDVDKPSDLAIILEHLSTNIPFSSF